MLAPARDTEDRNVLLISDSAAQRIQALAARQENPQGLMLRLAVSGGGCAGFQYAFSFDDAVTPDDTVFEHAGAMVVIDAMSLGMLNGSTLDFVEDIAGSAFQIRNPKATASCGCGSSFAM